ncbi:MAG TPA: DUF6206 family protein [Anaerolineae bacterium]|nr:DUF6206 family protein [Anaerolineae bacterium]HOR00918.1 DUF6206 family protein [Anaerolineae bacterium]
MDNPCGISTDVDLLREFERGLDPRRPERSRIPARILGYGEISTVFEVQAEGMRGLACKRLPIFRDGAEVARYEAVYAEYIRLLTEGIGLTLPPHGHCAFLDDAGRPVFYIVQQQLPYDSIGNRAIHLLPRSEALSLMRRILGELRRVWAFNRRQEHLQVAIDGQISNWSIAGPAALLYVDTSTPLYRVAGVEQLDTELFLRSAPSFMAWLLRWLFLKDVVDRYYEPHRVVVDLIANLYKEQRADLIPDVIAAANNFLAGEAAELAVAPIAEREVRDYYREDATIWRLYLAMRKVDRFIRARLLRGRYPYILPDEVKR